MVPFQRALAGIARQLAARGVTAPFESSGGKASMISSLCIAVAALDELMVSGGGTLSGTTGCRLISGPVGTLDTLDFERQDRSLVGTRGFATGKDPEKEWKIRTTQQILADLDLQGSDLRDGSTRVGSSSARRAEDGLKDSDEREPVELSGVAASSEGSSDDDDGDCSSNSSSSNSDDELSAEEAEAARVWNPKFDEWYEKAQNPESRPLSQFMFRDDGERIDADSPLKVEEFWPVAEDFPKLDIPNVPIDVHGELPPGERSMEEMITKMDFEGVEGLPSFHEMVAIEAWKKAEAKRLARERELKKQQEQAASRVRTVDEFGTSHAVGKRKSSVARVWLKEGQGSIVINGLPHVDYFRQIDYRMSVLQPFFETATLGHFDIACRVHGGGLSGQCQAVRHGISKALQLFDPEMRPALRSAGLLTRDPRVVERKKPGKAKARKSFQWVKR